MQAVSGAVPADQVTAHMELSRCCLTRCLFYRQQQLPLKTTCLQQQLNHWSPMLSCMLTQKRHIQRGTPPTATQTTESHRLSQVPLPRSTMHRRHYGITKNQARWSQTTAGCQKRKPLNSETFRYETASDLISYQHLEEREDKTSGKHQHCSLRQV